MDGLTPFYAEDLLYSAKELASKTEDGVSMLIFLKTVHETEWANFLERVGVGRSAAEEARLFTSRRRYSRSSACGRPSAGRRSRTVEGMMLHERALRLLASWEGLRNGDLEDAPVKLKFQYVISAQAYGNHKRARDLKAADTEFLLQRYPSLRVAYVDKASSLTKVAEMDGSSALKEAIRFYSVLIKGVRTEDGEACCAGGLPRAAAGRHHARRGQAREPEPRDDLHARRGAADDRHEPVRVL